MGDVSMGVANGRRAITHDAVIDYVLTNPGATYREISSAFGYTPEGIGVICRSDAFQARLEIRRENVVDPIVRQNLEQRLNGLAHASLDILMRKLDTSEDPKLALSTLEISTRAAAAAFGARTAAQSGNSGVTFVVQLPGPATTTSEWSSKFHAPVRPVVQDVPFTESAVGGQANLPPSGSLPSS